MGKYPLLWGMDITRSFVICKAALSNIPRYTEAKISQGTKKLRLQSFPFEVQVLGCLSWMEMVPRGLERELIMRGCDLHWGPAHP